MAFWDTLQIGDDIPPDSRFAGGYESDFSKPLGGGILGTAKGFDGDPFGGMTFPHDGDYKMGSHLQFHQRYATGYIGREHVTDQRNNEQIAYRNPHTPILDPNYLDSFAKESGGLTLKARPSTTTEQNTWCQFKGYLIGANGQAGKSLYLRNKFGRQNLIDWGASVTSVDDDNATPFLQQAPSPIVSSMISTYNRHSMSFGRSMARFTVPFGAKIGGSAGDSSDVLAWFVAYWSLEDVVASTDINSRLHALDTYTPGNPSAGNRLSELDQLELFWDQKIHITSHLHFDGDTSRGGVKTLNGKQVWRSDTKQINTSQPSSLIVARDVYIEAGNDRYPPSAAYPNGLIVYHINGKVRALQPMSPYMGQPKIVYEPIGGVYPYLPYVDPNTALVKRLGTQQYDNGDPAYQKYCDIFNISDVASFARPSAYAAALNSTAPSYRDNETMKIDFHIMKPLVDDNPDSRPYIDYTASVFGGSSAVTGPIDGGSATSPSSPSYKPVLDNEILYSPGHTTGEAVFTLKNEQAGTWDFSEFGAAATAIGPINDSTLRLRITQPVTANTLRLVSFIPDE